MGRQNHSIVLLSIIIVLSIQVVISPVALSTDSVLSSRSENTFQKANENTRVIQSLALENSSSIIVDGDTAYVGISGDPGYLVVIDIGNVFVPVESDRVEIAGHVIDIFVLGSHCYVVITDGDFWIFDVTDPYNIESIGFFSVESYTRTIFVENNLVYLGSYDGLRIVDVSDPTNPNELGLYYSYLQIESIHIRNGLAYLCHDGGLMIVDIHNPSSFTILGRYGIIGASGGMCLFDDILFVRYHYTGLVVLNISDPSDPHEIGNYEQYSWIYFFDMYFDGNFLFFAGGLYGVLIYDTFNFSTLIQVGSFDEGFRPRGIQGQEGYIYLVDNDNGLWILEHDCDQDELYSHREYEVGTPPNNPDIDLDNLLDGPEVEIYHTDPFCNDSDSDAIPDGWEVEHGLDPLSNDAHEDADGDTLDNLFEFELGTSPILVDSDGDTYSDDWEYNNGFDPLDPFDPPVTSTQPTQIAQPAQLVLDLLGSNYLLILGLIGAIWIIYQYTSSDSYEDYPYDGTSSQRKWYML
ncbi:hypothetical protein EU528_02315 [Candidatus Thorarchaeota archaeon]|nr:MAG: hypothetical protein EU528_02315 [Candidatus Thorarchaeota archaeon]